MKKWLKALFVTHYMPLFWAGVAIAILGVRINWVAEEGNEAGLVGIAFGFTLCVTAMLFDIRSRVEQLEEKKEEEVKDARRSATQDVD